MANKHDNPSEQILERRGYDGPNFLKQGFRPFFLAAGIWAAMAMAVWLAFLLGGEDLPLFGYLSGLEWHIHEMVYGFLPAAIAGFLLTAVPNWTGRLPVRGQPLLVLVVVWLAGRAAILVSGLIPQSLHLVIAMTDSLFLVFFTILLAREIISGGNNKNFPVIAIIGLLALSNIVFHMAVLDYFANLDSTQIAFLGIILVVLLVALIGGRITPSFTRNWMVRQQVTPLPAPRDELDQAGSVLVPVALLLLAFAHDWQASGYIALLAAVVHMGRLGRWHGLAAAKEPLVLILHIGYGWIAVGLFLGGLSVLSDNVPFVASIHAFTAGMIGSMILAVMTRATRGHSGSPLQADRVTLLIYILVNLSAITRIGSALFGHTQSGYVISALSWIAAFALFSIAYFPLFIKK